MKLALYGATGMIGSRLLAEALDRGHQVTAVVRDPARLTTRHERLSAVVGDVHDAGSVAALVAGHDAVISAYDKGPGGDSAKIVAAAHSLIDGVRRAAGPRPPSSSPAPVPAPSAPVPTTSSPTPTATPASPSRTSRSP